MFADPEIQLIDHLAPLLDVPVLGGVPEPRPAKFVRVMRTGNKRLSVAHRQVQMTVECWDEAGDAAAARLADQVEELLSDWEEMPASEDGWVSGAVPEVDPDSGCPRYVLTVAFIQFWD